MIKRKYLSGGESVLFSGNKDEQFPKEHSSKLRISKKQIDHAISESSDSGLLSEETLKYHIRDPVGIAICLIASTIHLSILCYCLFERPPMEYSVFITLEYPTTPKDSLGRICGFSRGVKDKPFAYITDINRCPSARSIIEGTCNSLVLCLAACPEKTIRFSDQEKAKTGLCSWGKNFYNIMRKAPEVFQTKIIAVECASYALASKPWLNFCLPEDIDNSSGLLRPGLPLKRSSWVQVSSEYLTPVQKMRHTLKVFYLWLVVAFGVAIAVLAPTLAILHVYPAFLVWTSLTAMFLLSGAFTIISIYRLGKHIWLSIYHSQSTVRTDKSLPFSAGVFTQFSPVWNSEIFLVSAAVIMAFLFVCYAAFLKLAVPKIPEAIFILRYTIKTATDVRYAVMVPVLAILVFAVVITLNMYLVILITQNGEPIFRVQGLKGSSCSCKFYKDDDVCEPNIFRETCFEDRPEGGEGPCMTSRCAVAGIHFPRTNLVLLIAELLLTYWELWLIKVWVETTLGLSYIEWYKKSYNYRVPVGHVLNAFWHVFRYHCGTLVLGSLLMMVSGPIRPVNQIILNVVLHNYDFSAIERSTYSHIPNLLQKFNVMTGRLNFIISAVKNVNYSQAVKINERIMSPRFQKVKLVNLLVDLILCACVLVVVVIVVSICSVIYFDPSVFMDFSEDFSEFGEQVMITYPSLMLFTILVAISFFISYFFNIYSVACNTVFYCYLSDSQKQQRDFQFLKSRLIANNMRHLEPPSLETFHNSVEKEPRF